MSESNQLAEQQQSSAPATQSPKRTFQQLVESDLFKSQIMAALPKHLTAERFIRVLMTATIKNPQLLDCTQESMFRGIFDCAAIGLEIDGRRAHLIPMRNRKKPGQPLEANLWLDYKGIAELVMRSGLVSNIHADVVCENDEFEYDRGELKRHKIDFKKDRGAPYAAYCLIRMKDGSEKVEVMDRTSIERIRQSSPGADADPWRNHWGEMAKKTVFKRVSKWVPLSPEIKNAMESDNEDEPLNVTNSNQPAAPQIEGGSPPQPEQAPPRPAPPKRASKGAAAVAENAKPEPAIDVTVTSAKETPAMATTQPPEGKVFTQSSTAATKDAPKPAEPPKEAPKPAPEPAKPAAPAATPAPATAVRAFLKPDEEITAVCKIKSSQGLMARAGADKEYEPSVIATVEGEFNNRIFAVGVAGAVEKAGQVVLPDAWKPGSTLRLKLIGRPASRNPEVPSVKVLSWELPEAQPVSPGVEME